MVFALLGQGPFAKAYGGSSEDRARSVVLGSDGNYLVVGWTQTYGAGAEDWLVLKLSPSGEVLWAKAYGGSSWDRAYSAVAAPGGCFVLAGQTESFGAGEEDVLVVKLDFSGEVEWARAYGLDGAEEGFSIARTSDDGFVVAGSAFEASDWDMLVLKLDSLGNLQWAKALGSSEDEEAYSIVQTADGGFVLVGYTEGFGAGLQDVIVVKLSPDGEVEWAKAIGGENWDEAHAVLPTPDGGVAVAGKSLSPGPGFSVILLKIGSDGELEWARAVGGIAEVCQSLTLTSEGSYVLVGSSGYFSTGEDDFLILKLSSSGSVVWAKSLGGDSGDVAYSVVQADSENLVVVGETESYGEGSSDFLVLKMPLSGEYPGCLRDRSPDVDTPSFDVASVSLSSSALPLSVTSAPLIASEVSVSVEEVCPSRLCESATSPSPVRAVPMPGGVLFRFSQPERLFVYSSDGRLLRSIASPGRELFVPLRKGVYFWRVGTASGRVAVR